MDCELCDIINESSLESVPYKSNQIISDVQQMLANQNQESPDADNDTKSKSKFSQLAQNVSSGGQSTLLQAKAFQMETIYSDSENDNDSKAKLTHSKLSANNTKSSIGDTSHKNCETKSSFMSGLKKQS